ncbi:hypothetical protein IFM89_010580 [Coptis chinensis]|uniref:Uncharacterized protein n=1 Tax=Coptis chinensis TaxID=261450 RepID=A0A835IMK8_9MAGN|nr:hypothetical protein IFM89_010580 [Coptis chinensis]
MSRWFPTASADGSSERIPWECYEVLNFRTTKSSGKNRQCRSSSQRNYQPQASLTAREDGGKKMSFGKLKKKQLGTTNDNELVIRALGLIWGPGSRSRILECSDELPEVLLLPPAYDYDAPIDEYGLAFPPAPMPLAAWPLSFSLSQDVFLRKQTEEKTDDEEEYKKIRKGIKKFAEKKKWGSFELIATSYIVGMLQQSNGKIMNFFRDKFLSSYLAGLLLKKSDFDCGKLTSS